MFEHNWVFFILEISSIMILLVLLYGVGKNKTERNTATKFFLISIVFAISSSILSVPITLPNEIVFITKGEIKVLFISAFATFAGIVVSFTYYLIAHLNEKTYVSNGVSFFVLVWEVLISIIFSILAISNNIMIFSEDLTYTFTKVFGIVQVLTIIPGIFVIGIIVSCKRVIANSEIVTWVIFSFLPVIGIFLVPVFKMCALDFLISLGLLILFINIYSDKDLKIAEQDKALTESKMRVMLSQIQPHFMYNSLNSIYYLIEKDPELAQKSLSTFSDYLRSNINALKAEKPIPFSDELKHIKAYLDLEKVRFEEELQIVYEISTTDFKVPALSIQPLVENAVKHGVSQKKGGGMVRIKTSEKGEYYEVAIHDTGVGFNAKNSKKEETTGIGLETAKERISTMCMGSVEVHSMKNIGTDVIVKIPKELKGTKI